MNNIFLFCLLIIVCFHPIIHVSSLDVSVGFITKEGELQFIESDTEIRSVSSENLSLFCNASDWKLCAWYWPQIINTNYSCVYFNGQTDESCPEELTRISGDRCQVNIASTNKTAHDGQWTCELNQFSVPGGNDSGLASFQLKVLEGVPVFLSATDVPATVGDTIELSCYAIAEENIQLKWTLNGTDYQGTLESKCDESSCNTTSMFTFQATLDHDQEKLICTSIRNDTLGRKIEESASVNLIVTSEPETSTFEWTVTNILILVILIILLILLLLVLILCCYKRKYCCFKETNENDEHRKPQDNVSYIQSSTITNSRPQGTNTEPQIQDVAPPLPPKLARNPDMRHGIGVRTKPSQYPVAPPPPPQIHHQSWVQSPPRAPIPTRIPPDQRVAYLAKRIPPPYDVRTFRRLQAEAGATDEVNQFSFEGYESPEGDGDDLSSLVSMSHVDDIEFDTLIQDLSRLKSAANANPITSNTAEADSSSDDTSTQESSTDSSSLSDDIQTELWI